MIKELEVGKSYRRGDNQKVTIIKSERNNFYKSYEFLGDDNIHYDGDGFPCFDDYMGEVDKRIIDIWEDFKMEVGKYYKTCGGFIVYCFKMINQSKTFKFGLNVNDIQERYECVDIARELILSYGADGCPIDDDFGFAMRITGECND